MDGLWWKTLFKMDDLGVSLFSEASIWCELRDSMIQQKPPSNQKQQLSTE